ncbi:MAG: hypothetical protein E6J29_02400 [Chloroflexi bacterium]|nr:MAG: hypothetical protein E6J29_02400 [Chloroflexota bacterium]TMD55454.1 MAG: hypothetical protein E6I85_03055 [Chloroflexota bacterium]
MEDDDEGGGQGLLLWVPRRDRASRAGGRHRGQDPEPGPDSGQHRGRRGRGARGRGPDGDGRQGGGGGGGGGRGKPGRGWNRGGRQRGGRRGCRRRRGAGRGHATGWAHRAPLGPLPFLFELGGLRWLRMLRLAVILAVPLVAAVAVGVLGRGAVDPGWLGSRDAGRSGREEGSREDGGEDGFDDRGIPQEVSRQL